MPLRLPDHGSSCRIFDLRLLPFLRARGQEHSQGPNEHRRTTIIMIALAFSSPLSKSRRSLRAEDLLGGDLGDAVRQGEGEVLGY